ncbi:hypothetical protein BP5796_13256 [Coleophoma crateriformis]|uniref:Zn(2)-C6 fungal-type domain-containing protein n=1 Tax=Coleophoma crateriformis TaxID=565419 RepID=A0A3D8Q235_9HELO|nr:hypothetical protein BP5796_13256 [Coleophoma crateriformis]
MNSALSPKSQAQLPDAHPYTTSKARLRTKTGCLTCRKRKLKCGEERPSCSKCSIAGRQCEWPKSGDLRDRRHCLPSNQLQSVMLMNGILGDDSRKDAEFAERGLYEAGQAKNLHLYRSPNMPTTIRSNLEAGLIHYYLDTFVSIVLLSNLDPRFYSEYRWHVVNLALNCDTVKCAVLACCATNKYMRSKDVRFHKLSMTYYSQAIEGVNQMIAQLSSADGSPGDALLTAVIYMYINTLWGSEVAQDAPKHVAGAMQLIKMRYADRSSPLYMTRPFDRVTTESVLYQSFLLSLRHPFELDFQVDEDYLARTESIYSSLTQLDPSTAAHSPVLGAPLPFYRLLLNIIQYHSSDKQLDPSVLAKMKSEMNYWETALMTRDKSDTESPLAQNPHMDTVGLYILAGSLLLDWIIELPDSQSRIDIFSLSSGGKLDDDCSISDNSSSKKPRWQLVQGLRILQGPCIHENWAHSFLGPWPMLIFGYAVETKEDIELIKKVLDIMWHRLGYGEIERTSKELERLWRLRKENNNSPQRTTVQRDVN